MSLPLQNVEGALLGTMTGDSLGFGVDGLDPGPLHQRFPTVESVYAAAPSGYGAATEMMTATAESLLAHPEFDPADMASRLAAAASDSRRYGAGTQIALQRLRAGIPWQEAAAEREGRTSFGNSAATRMAPIAVLYHDDMERLRWVAEEAAALTHGHAWACEGAALQATAIAVAAAAAGREVSGESFLLAIGREASMREFRTRYEMAAVLVSRESDWQRVVERLGNARTALGSVVTAAYCFARSPGSYQESVARAVHLAGNAAAIAAMTGAISGAHLGSQAIPSRWLAGLECSGVSPERLRGLAARLRGLSPFSRK